MKKLACWGVLLCFALTVIVAVPSAVCTASAAEDDSIVVYVYDEQDWNLNIYCYVVGGGDFGSGWPGTSLDKAPEKGENWYSYTMPSDPTGKTIRMIIFNSVDDSIRFEVQFNNSAVYYHTYMATDATGFKTKDDAEQDAVKKRPLLVDTIYIYNYSTEFNEVRWKNIYAVCYNNATGDQLGDGVALEPYTTLGANWYKYDLPEQARAASAADYKFRARVVVSDGESGREQLTIVAPVAAKKYYNTYRDYGFDSALKAKSDEFNCSYEKPKTGSTTLYYYNTQRWKEVYAYAYWTYVGANNTLVEDFGPWPGTQLNEVEGHENWYYIELLQNPANMTSLGAKGVGVVFNGNTKGKIKQDAFIGNQTDVYVNYDGTQFKSFEACEASSVMKPPLPELDDYLMDFDKVDTQEKTETIKESASLIAPIVVLSIAAVICAGVGAVLIVFTVRRKKNDLR